MTSNANIEPRPYSNIKKCDACGAGCINVIHDAKITKLTSLGGVGSWAYMCTSCWEQLTHQVHGTGIGQRYEFNMNTNEWEKTHG